METKKINSITGSQFNLYKNPFNQKNNSKDNSHSSIFQKTLDEKEQNPSTNLAELNERIAYELESSQRHIPQIEDKPKVL
jgi:hypothetical protein